LLLLLLLLLLLFVSSATAPRDAQDPSGHIISLVLRWRQLRQAALEAEISRINSILRAEQDDAPDAREL
jgi:hypothetical protein